MNLTTNVKNAYLIKKNSRFSDWSTCHATSFEWLDSSTKLELEMDASIFVLFKFFSYNRSKVIFAIVLHNKDLATKHPLVQRYNTNLRRWPTYAIAEYV